VSLRHLSTGQWARNKAVRAKYDKEVSIHQCVILWNNPPTWFQNISLKVVAAKPLYMGYCKTPVFTATFLMV
jgi:hypothetical protein